MQRFRFGTFDLDLRSYALSRDGRAIPLERRAFDLLVLLLRHRDRVVSKQELMDSLWPGHDVGESTLTRLVSLVRKALSESGADQRWIRTAQRRGYRFVGTVREVGDVPPLSDLGLIGRDRELATLEAGLARAAGGEASVAWLEGPTGIGKTALCRALEALARSRGFRVARARCGIVPGAPALWPWIQLVRQLAGEPSDAAEGGASHAAVPHVAGGRGDDRDGPFASSPSRRHAPEEEAGAAELARLVGARDVTSVAAWSGEPGEATAPEPADVSHARFDLFDCTTAWLRRAAARAPVLVVLDDLHDCDPSSLRLLQFVVRHVGDTRAAFVGCLRYVDLSAGAPLADAVRAAETAVHLALAPLSRDATDAWVRRAGAPAPELTATAIHERSAGNPLFIQHMVRSLETAADPRGWLDWLAEAHAPRTLLDAVRREIEGLSPACVRMLGIGSVLGRELSISTVAAVEGIAVTELLRCADEACGRGVLEPVAGAPDRYRFAHPLSRDALYDGTAVSQRTRWHLGIADALASEPEGAHTLLRVAHHLWHARPAAPLDRVRAAQVRAARRAMRALSFDDAVRAAERALELAGADDDPLEAIELLLLLGRASHLRGDEPGMRRAYLGAADAARALGRPDLMAQAALGFSGVGSIGRLDTEWVDLVESILEKLDETHGHLRARLLLRLSLEYYWAGAAQRPRALELSRTGERVARSLDDPLERATALDLRLALCRVPDRLAEALARADEILDLLHGRPPAEVEVRARLKRYEILLELGRIAEAEIEYRAIVARAEELRLFWPTRLVLMRGLMDGRHAEVERSLTESLRSGRLDLRASGEWTQSFMVVLFQLRLQQGRLSELLPELPGWVARFPQFPGARVALALAHAGAGHRAEARAILGAIDLESAACDQTWLWLLAMVAEAHACVGMRSELPAVRAALLPYAGRVVELHSSACLGSVAYFLGRVCAALGREAEALRHFEASLEVDARLGRYLHARTLASLVETHARAGGATADRARLAEEALELATVLDLRDVEARLRELAGSSQLFPGAVSG